jgi:phospholipase C
MKSPNPLNSNPNSSFSRRKFLRVAGSTAGALALGAGNLSALTTERRIRTLPKPQQSGIEHIVVLMMENRSFDHFLGWLPGANGRQAGLSYTDRAGVAHPTYPLAPDYQGCGHIDPDHTYQGARIEYNNGACDGWLRAQNDLFAIGYYNRSDLKFLSAATAAWTTCDNYFSAIMAGTYPNRIYQYAAQTDRLDNSSTLSTLPTIFDRLADHNLQARVYFSDIPLIALWGPKYLPLARPVSSFFTDCAAGNLPHVSFVDPRFLGESMGLSNDDHPFADIRNGEAFLNSVYEAVIKSPNWKNTVFIINYDEWGGFFDHVAPALAPIPPADAALGSDGRRGFRVPSLVISPWSMRGAIAHDLYDHTSILRMMEWRWNLRPLTVRDTTARNIAEVLDFSQPNYQAPRFKVPTGPFGTVCLSGTLDNEWTQLGALAGAIGFPLR